MSGWLGSVGVLVIIAATLAALRLAADLRRLRGIHTAIRAAERRSLDGAETPHERLARRVC